MDRGGAWLMINFLTVTNYLNESLELELRYPEKSGFAVTNIEGLGPSKGTINTSELATMDGSVYNSGRVASRNIVLTLKFMFSPTIEEVRLKSYKYFPVNKKIKLVVKTDNRELYTYGYVESNTPTMFSNFVGTQISIICPDAYLYSEELVVTLFSGAEALFEFPFENASLSENLLEMSSLATYTMKNIYYEGTVATGILIYIHAVGPISNISIYNSITTKQMHLNIDLVAGDDVTISTVKGDKYISLLRDGVTYNILNYLESGVDWLQLNPGDNVFVYDADSGVTNLQFKIENRFVYEGV